MQQQKPSAIGLALGPCLSDYQGRARGLVQDVERSRQRTSEAHTQSYMKPQITTWRSWVWGRKERLIAALKHQVNIPTKDDFQRVIYTSEVNMNSSEE